jgi:O-methyltransferase involved in polyketide biosynthesis
MQGTYVSDVVIDLLAQNGFDFNLPTFFIYEGNTMYLSHESTKQILSELRRSVRRFRLSFDYMAESVISKTTGDAGITSLVESFANMGAPLVYSRHQNPARARLPPINFRTSSSTGSLVGPSDDVAHLQLLLGVRSSVSKATWRWFLECVLGV